jgi:hypothetical protein
MTHNYNVLIFIGNPYSSSYVPPVYSLFGGSNGSGVFKSVKTVELPNNKTSCDTLIGTNCGKKSCDGCGDTFKARPFSIDYLIFVETLKRWKELPDYQTKGMVIAKSSSVSSGAKASDLSDALIGGLEAIPETDIFYFSKWLDRPDQYNVLNTNLNTGMKTIRTWNPHGMQALALTPAGLAKLDSSFNPDRNPVVCRPFAQVLNALVQNGTLKATSTSPTLLHYDATLVSEIPPASICSEPNAKKPTVRSDAAKFSYLKTCEARGETYPEAPLNRRISSDLSLFWVVIIILVAAIVVWVLLKLGSLYTYPSRFSTLSPFAPSSQGAEGLAFL